jgi:hypothetical protein
MREWPGMLWRTVTSVPFASMWDAAIALSRWACRWSPARSPRRGSPCWSQLLVRVNGIVDGSSLGCNGTRCSPAPLRDDEDRVVEDVLGAEAVLADAERRQVQPMIAIDRSPVAASRISAICPATARAAASRVPYAI